MIGFEILNKIMVGYLKVQADKEPKSYSEVAGVSKVAENNVILNAKFLSYIGILEGERGQFKLTPDGKRYAQALDWGKLEEANSVLKEVLKDKALTRRTLGFVDINKPVSKEDLVGQIAIIAGVPKEPRFNTGIKAFVDMLMSSGLIKEDTEGKLSTEKPVEPMKAKTEEEITSKPEEKSIEVLVGEKRMSFPITLSFSIDNQTNEENLRKLLKVIKEVFSN